MFWTGDATKRFYWLGLLLVICLSTVVGKDEGMCIQQLWGLTLLWILTLLGTAHSKADNNIFGRIMSLKLLRAPTRPLQGNLLSYFLPELAFAFLLVPYSCRGGT